MNWFALADAVALPLVFVLGRYSARYHVVRIKRRYKQDVGSFIRGR